MKVYVIIETCCMHFSGVFKDKSEAEAVMLERGYSEDNGYSIYEYDL
jgi:hypothetical protein